MNRIILLEDAPNLNYRALILNESLEMIEKIDEVFDHVGEYSDSTKEFFQKFGLQGHTHGETQDLYFVDNNIQTIDEAVRNHREYVESNFLKQRK